MITALIVIGCIVGYAIVGGICGAIIDTKDLENDMFRGERLFFGRFLWPCYGLPYAVHLVIRERMEEKALVRREKAAAERRIDEVLRREGIDL